MSELGQTASDGGHGGHIQGSESGDHGLDDRHLHTGHEVHSPEHNMKGSVLYILLVAASLSSSGLTWLATSGYEKWQKKKDSVDQGRLAAHDQVAKAWKEQLQTNVYGFPFSPRAAERIGSLLELSRNSNAQIACTARLRLSIAYFATRQFGKADAELYAAETKCVHDDGLMEELHYLHGRTNSEMANEERSASAIRSTYESLAWKNYNESWRYSGRQKEFAAVSVLQMCILSTRRSGVTAAELRDLQSRLNEITSDPLAANIASKNGLMTYLIAQEKIIAPMIANMQSQEEKRASAAIPNLQMHVDPLQVPPGPTKSLQSLFVQPPSGKPVATRKPAVAHNRDGTYKRNRSH